MMKHLCLRYSQSYAKLYIVRFLNETRNHNALEEMVMKKKTKKTRLFIGNLANSVTIRQLYSFFSEYGTIIDIEILTNHTGASLNFGFIRFNSEASAAYTLEHAHNTILEGYPLKLSYTGIQ